MTLSLVLVVLALLCALAAAFNFSFGPRTPNLIALSLAFWFASLLIR